MIRWFVRGFFRLKLLWGISSFLCLMAVYIALALLKQRQSLLITLLLVCVVATGFIYNSFLALGQEGYYQVQPPSLTSRLALPSQQLTYEETVLEYQRQKELLEIQPNHRDVLINTSLLAEQLGQKTEALQYWNQAQQLDPNEAIFTK